MFARHAFEDLPIERLEMIVDPDNQPSLRVADKAGFRRDGTLRAYVAHPDGRRRDAVMLSLLAGEYETRRPSEPG